LRPIGSGIGVAGLFALAFGWWEVAVLWLVEFVR